MRKATHRTGSILLGSILPVLCPSAPGAAEVRYELRPGSVLIDDCLDCDRPLIERPLVGGFLLTAGPGEPGSTPYVLSEIRMGDPPGDYPPIGGTGSYTRSKDASSVELTLDLDIGGNGGIRLSSGLVKLPFDCWPAIEVQAAEGPPYRDPLHIYTIRLVAAPETRYARYELIPGFEQSHLIHNCLPCLRPLVPIPLVGSFLLGRIESTPFSASAYRVEAIDFRNEKGEEAWRLGGSGCYRQSGEFAVVQDMDLRLQVNQTPGVILSAACRMPDPCPLTVSLPGIEIHLLGPDPASPIHQYLLHLVARPEGPVLFRRGDASGDGRVNISDAIHFLWWRFLGAPAPGCLDAADVDGDGSHQVTDATYLLSHLFLGGAAPPSPGPESCGPPAGPAPGCESYTACGG